MINESWRDSRDEKKSSEYWSKAKTWNFDISDGGRLEVFALTKQEAIKRARAYQRWSDKQGFKDNKVILGSVRLV